jgi:uncharacterized protein
MRLIALISLIITLNAIPVYAGDYEDGVGAFFRQDYKTAFEKLEPLAKQGNDQAQGLIGKMYELGQGISQDYGQAVKWCRLSAEQGNSGSQTFLGQMYASGKGVEQNFKEAVKWYRLAAEQGRLGGQLSLGKAYLNGHGVTQDYIEGLKWYFIGGVEKLDLWQKHINHVKGQMTSDEIAEAQKLAREWMARHK